VVVSTDHTTTPKKDKVGTSSVEVPTAQALVARLESKAPDDTLIDDDPDLLTSGAVESKIIYRMSSRLQSDWPDSGKLDCPIWYFEWSNFCAP
jgi:hypothetical protein